MTLRDDVLELLADIDYMFFSKERNGPHVVVSFDPMTKGFVAFGVYPDAMTALLAAEKKSEDFNKPENNDGVKIYYFPVPLKLEEG